MNFFLLRLKELPAHRMSTEICEQVYREASLPQGFLTVVPFQTIRSCAKENGNQILFAGLLRRKITVVNNSRILK